MRKNRNVFKYFCVSFLTLLCGITMFSATGSALQVNAAGNSPIHSITGYENHSHVVTQNLFGTTSDYTESKYKSTGIQVYPANNKGTTTSGTSIELD